MLSSFLSTIYCFLPWGKTLERCLQQLHSNNHGSGKIHALPDSAHTCSIRIENKCLPMHSWMDYMSVLLVVCPLCVLLIFTLKSILKISRIQYIKMSFISSLTTSNQFHKLQLLILLSCFFFFFSTVIGFSYSLI